jgi:hypothetical protein
VIAGPDALCGMRRPTPQHHRLALSNTQHVRVRWATLLAAGALLVPNFAAAQQLVGVPPALRVRKLCAAQGLLLPDVTLEGADSIHGAIAASIDGA